MNIFKSVKQYEKWLREQLDDVVEKDLASKHEKMAADPFQFLRATYWRWAETVYDLCPELKEAPHALAVGDIHVENFGTWRDAEGRLVWGVNDFDEAAKMPYVLDLVRLASSAVLANVPGISDVEICDSIAEGYAKGLKMPKPLVLDRHHEWLRETVVVTTHERKKFWKKFDPKEIEEEKPEKVDPIAAKDVRHRYRKVIEHARPDRRITLQYYSRQAGTGSLGRRRIFGVGPWQGELIVREAKAMLRSGWALAHGGAHRLRCADIAAGPHRSPDPTYQLRGRVLVRRLTPNDFKIEVKQPKKNKGEEEKFNALPPAQLISTKMLCAMGHELASVHCGTLRQEEIESHFNRGGKYPLRQVVKVISSAIKQDWQDWRDQPRKWPSAAAAE